MSPHTVSAPSAQTPAKTKKPSPFPRMKRHPVQHQPGLERPALQQQLPDADGGAARQQLPQTADRACEDRVRVSTRTWGSSGTAGCRPQVDSHCPSLTRSITEAGPPLSLTTGTGLSAESPTCILPGPVRGTGVTPGRPNHSLDNTESQHGCESRQRSRCLLPWDRVASNTSSHLGSLADVTIQHCPSPIWPMDTAISPQPFWPLPRT